MDFLRCRSIATKLNRLIRRRRKPITEELVGDSSCQWDTLPPHLAVDKIFSNLCVADRVRMQSVCKSWKSALTRRDLPPAPEAPWLIMPPAAADEKEIRLKSMHENRIYRFKPPHLASRKRRRSRKDGYWCCCGSSDGWLLMAVGRVIRDMELLLWNPLSGETKNLPSPSTEEDGDDDDDDDDYRVLEQGMFDVKRDIMEIKSTTNVHYFSDSITGWFTPKLF